MKVYVHKSDIPPHFILQHEKKELVVARSIYRDLGSVWVSKDVLWKMEGESLYQKSSHLHFLIILGYSPEQVWEEAGQYSTNNHWIL
jgi:hypothetical protein